MSDEEKGFTIRDRRGGAEPKEPVVQAGTDPGTKAPATEGPEDASREEAGAANITSLVFWLAGMAHAGLGEIPDPVTGLVEKNMEASRQIIDLLGVLEQKTRGNLTADEERIMNTITTELRMRYVQAVNATP
jgi:hypothetical protein